MTTTSCILASQFAAQSALSALASALDQSAGKTLAEKQRQEALLAGLPALPAETVDGTLASVLGIDSVRTAMLTARTALSQHIDGLNILLGTVASQREQITRMAETVAPTLPTSPSQPAQAVPETPSQSDSPPAPAVPAVPAIPSLNAPAATLVIGEDKPTPAPFTLAGQDRDTIERMSRAKFTTSLAQKWCAARNLDYPGLLPFTDAIRATLAADQPTSVAANEPSSPPPTNGTLFPVDEDKTLDTLTQQAQEDADKQSDQPAPPAKPSGNKRSQTRHSSR